MLSEVTWVVEGGGKNNADVFDRVGLMFITNANAKTSSAGTCSFVKLSH